MEQPSITCEDLPIVEGIVPMMKVVNNQPSKNIPLEKDWAQRVSIISHSFKNYIDKTLNFEVREDDVYIMGMAKSGTTWLQEIVWLITNNFDIESSLKSTISSRIQWLE